MSAISGRSDDLLGREGDTAARKGTEAILLVDEDGPLRCDGIAFCVDPLWHVDDAGRWLRENANDSPADIALIAPEVIVHIRVAPLQHAASRAGR